MSKQATDMQDTTQQTPEQQAPEHHQTQAAAGSPQAGGVSAAQSIANMTGGSTSASDSILGTGAEPAADPKTADRDHGNVTR